jgi:transposase
MGLSALEWVAEDVATGMTSAGGELRPVFGNPQAPDVGSCEELTDRGLPRVSKRRSFSVRTRFADWVAADATEYFGDHCGKEPVRHRVWSFKRQTKSGDVKVLVPALALMRALLRPHTYVLAQMFQPHALDLVCRFIDGAPRPTRPWPRARMSAESQPFLGSMTWMHCFPSARLAANSIYDRAREGWLDMELPGATVELSVSGIAQGQEILVTHLTVSTLEAEEKPFPFADTLSQRIDLRSENRIASSPKLGLNSEGFRLSDAEWKLVGPLVTRSHARRYAPRDVLDALLSVSCGVAPSLSSQLGDRNMRRVYGSQVAYWRANGTLSQVEAILARVRDRPLAEGSQRPQRPQRPQPPKTFRTVTADLQIGRFEPMDDSEWQMLQPLFGRTRSLRENQAHTTREIADRIISALAPGGSWRKTGTYSIGHAADARHRLLVKDGRWDEIVQVLRKLRPQKQAAVECS